MKSRGLLTLFLKLADDSVQEHVLRSHMAPPHRHGADTGMEPTPAVVGRNKKMSQFIQQTALTLWMCESGV